MTKSALRAIARRYGLEAIVLFGSRARGAARADSDADTCVVAPRFRGDEIDLANDLGRVLGAPADLVFFHRADPVLKYHMLSNGKLLFGTSRGFVRLRVAAIKAWQDCRKIDEARKASLERRS